MGRLSNPRRLVPPAAGDPDLHLRLNRTTRIAEVAPQLLAHGTTYILGWRGQRLAGGSATAFKGAI
jgi:hypothetical protein